MLHLYFVWVILPLVAVAVVVAVSDLTATRGAPFISQRPPVAGKTSWLVNLLGLIVTLTATALLLTIT